MEKYFSNIVEKIKIKKNLQNTILFFHAHVVPSSLEFFKFLPKIGLVKDNIFIQGKSYSTVPEIEKELKLSNFNISTSAYPTYFGEYDNQNKLKADFNCKEEILKRSKINTKLIIMDSGSALMSSVANILNSNTNKIGVELTTQGTFGQYEYPVIELALCETKKIIESPFIGKSIVFEIERRGLIEQDKTYAVLGCGSIGTSVIKALKEKSINVICYDKNKGFNKPLEEIIQEADYLIGCSGTPIINGNIANFIKKDIKIISASSKDTEFKKFFIDLKLNFNKKNPFSDMINIVNNKKVTLINGGFPINFNRLMEVEKEFEHEIILTRGLWLVAILQAINTNYLNPKEKRVVLNKKFQKIALIEWFNLFKDNLTRDRASFIENFIKKF